MRNNIIIIGNAPITHSIADAVEQSDGVVRFNFPRHDPQLVGTRTDFLFSINSYRHTRRFIDRGIYDCPFFVHARKIVLPWAPEVLRTLHPKSRHPIKDFIYRRKYDNTPLAIDAFTQQGKCVEVLSATLNKQCYQQLAFKDDEYARMIPSTGFIALQYILSLYPDAAIDIHGFTWQGWDGHPWARERAWIERHPAISVHMPDSGAT